MKETDRPKTANPVLSEKELRYLQDQDFLLTKAVISTSVQETLLAQQPNIKTLFDREMEWVKTLDFSASKIAKGENYRGLPYWVMDYPKRFDKENLFTVRSMVWWGNEATLSLLLQGAFLDQPGKKLLSNLTEITEKGHLYFCVNTTPWEHHFGADNYLPLSEVSHSELQKERSFVKIATHLPIAEIEQLPTFVEQSVQLFTKLLQVDHG